MITKYDGVYWYAFTNDGSDVIVNTAETDKRPALMMEVDHRVRIEAARIEADSWEALAERLDTQAPENISYTFRRMCRLMERFLKSPVFIEDRDRRSKRFSTISTPSDNRLSKK
jgi:hypothetical protein